MASMLIVCIAVATNFLWFQSSSAQTTRSPQDFTCAGYCSNQATAPTGTPPSDLGSPASYIAYANACTDQFCCCNTTLGCQYFGQQVTCDPGFFFDPNTAAPGYTCRPVSEMNQVAQCCATNFTAGCPSTTTQRITTRVTSPTTTLQTTTTSQDTTCYGYCTNQSTAPTGLPPLDLGSPAPYTAFVNGCTDQLCCCDTSLGCQYFGQQVTCDPGFFFDPNTAAPGYTCRPGSEKGQVAQCCAVNASLTGCPTTTVPTTTTTRTTMRTPTVTTVMPSTTTRSATTQGTTTRASTVITVIPSTTSQPTTTTETTTRASNVTTVIPPTTARPTTTSATTTAAAPASTTTAALPQSTTPRTTAVQTTTAGFGGTPTPGAPQSTTTMATGSCAGCGCGTFSLSSQANCVEMTAGPTNNAQWRAGLNTNVDQTLRGGDIVAYQIQWPSTSWSGWYITGVNDIDVISGSCGLRRMWAYFFDMTHKYIICT